MWSHLKNYHLAVFGEASSKKEVKKRKTESSEAVKVNTIYNLESMLIPQAREGVQLATNSPSMSGTAMNVTSTAKGKEIFSRSQGKPITIESSLSCSTKFPYDHHQ